MSVVKEVPSSLNTYDADLSAWAERQTALLRERRSDRLDWDNIAEEIESLGKSEVNELESRLAVLLEHLIKLQYGLRDDPRAGWKRTVLEQRQRIARMLKNSPSLGPKTSQLTIEVYPDAREAALASFEEHEATNVAHYIAAIPAELPFELERLLDRDFIPDARSKN